MFGISWATPTTAVLLTALLIFVMRMIDVSMGTIRMIMITRGMRRQAVMIGFVEITIWVLAISQVINNLDNVINILAYAGGFATGTYVGMRIEDRLALGIVSVHIISRNHGHEIAEKVRAGGFGATEVEARGQSGPVTMIAVVAPRKDVPQVIRLANTVDATAFVAIEDLRQTRRGFQMKKK
jgi:uncharacterized protein YebE (UPF0316 family)